MTSSAALPILFCSRSRKRLENLRSATPKSCGFDYGKSTSHLNRTLPSGSLSLRNGTVASAKTAKGIPQLLARILMFCLMLWQAPSMAQSPQAPPAAMAKLIERCQPKIAKVIGAGAGRIDGYATGIVVSPDGLVLTTQGVFLDGAQVKIELTDGKSYPATILRRNRTLQLALLKISPTEELDHFLLSDSDVGQKGDWVIALSNAFKVASKSEPVSAMIGVISLRSSMEARLNKRDVAYDGPLVLIDAITSNPGASGGAVVTFDENLVGMVGKLINSSETNTRLNYAVPSAVLKQFVEGTLAAQAVTTTLAKKVEGNGELGIVLFKTGDRSAPAYIDRVRRGSPAAKQKLKPDDMIVSLGGTKVGSVKEYLNAEEELTAGETITIIVKRGLEIIRLQITPQEKK